jgi:hypothetical protein
MNAGFLTETRGLGKGLLSAIRALEQRCLSGKLSGVERVVKKLGLHDEKIAPLIEDREEAMRVFWEILERGQAYYSTDATEQRHPGMYRVIPLKGS